MEVEIAQKTCCSCNIVFWISLEHNRRLKSCHNRFYCPNGHPQSYKGETDAQKVENLERDLRCERRKSLDLGRSNSALRGVITRNKK